jgi:hypothetical protein
MILSPNQKKNMNKNDTTIWREYIQKCLEVIHTVQKDHGRIYGMQAWFTQGKVFDAKFLTRIRDHGTMYFTIIKYHTLPKVEMSLVYDIFHMHNAKSMDINTINIKRFDDIKYAWYSKRTARWKTLLDESCSRYEVERCNGKRQIMDVTLITNSPIVDSALLLHDIEYLGKVKRLICW